MNQLLLGLGAVFALQLFFVSTLMVSAWAESRWTRAGEASLQLAEQMQTNERERRERTGEKSAAEAA
jgi:hypothetical protein